MACWNASSFGNDDAPDWLFDLSDGKDAAFVLETLNKVAKIQPTEYLELSECCQALAAAELVAAVLDKPPSEFPEEAAAWLSSHKLAVDSKLLAAVHGAIARITTNSELKELFDASESKEEWYQSV